MIPRLICQLTNREMVKILARWPLVSDTEESDFASCKTRNPMIPAATLRALSRACGAHSAVEQISCPWTCFPFGGTLSGVQSMEHSSSFRGNHFYFLKGKSAHVKHSLVGSPFTNVSITILPSCCQAGKVINSMTLRESDPQRRTRLLMIGFAPVRGNWTFLALNPVIEQNVAC